MVPGGWGFQKACACPIQLTIENRLARGKHGSSTTAAVQAKLQTAFKKGIHGVSDF
jgi:hypothetical protein